MQVLFMFTEVYVKVNLNQANYHNVKLCVPFGLLNESNEVMFVSVKNVLLKLLISIILLK